MQDPLNIDIDNSTWTPITLNAGCSMFLAQSRGTFDWKWSNSSTGTPFFTVKNIEKAFGEPINLNKGDVLFYVQLVSEASDVLEVATGR